jgi:hypothetical protein
VEYWTRPGKEKGVSASTGYRKRSSDGSPLLKVFTSSAEPLQPDKAYSKSQFFAQMQHGGDWVKAAADLRRHGFGQPGTANGEAAGGPADIENMPLPPD